MCIVSYEMSGHFHRCLINSQSIVNCLLFLHVTMYTHTHTQTCTHVHTLHLHARTRTHARTHTHTHAHTHTHTNTTHTHTHTLTSTTLGVPPNLADDQFSDLLQGHSFAGGKNKEPKSLKQMKAKNEIEQALDPDRARVSPSWW